MWKYKMVSSPSPLFKWEEVHTTPLNSSIEIYVFEHLKRNDKLLTNRGLYMSGISLSQAFDSQELTFLHQTLHSQFPNQYFEKTHNGFYICTYSHLDTLEFVLPYVKSLIQGIYEPMWYS